MSTMLRYASTLGLVLSLMLGLSSWANANTVSGELKFLDDSDAVTTTYQAGDTLKLQVTDADRNSDAGTAETVTVLVTSDTENTGTAPRWVRSLRVPTAVTARLWSPPTALIPRARPGR